jgi:hypothetical protein
MRKGSWVAGTALLACTGALVGYGLSGSAGAATASADGTAASTAGVAVGRPGTVGRTPRVLSGKRQVKMVRAEESESNLTLSADGRLIEAETDDPGRQLFVPTPLGGNKYLVKVFPKAGDDSTNGEPVCWQSYNPGGTKPLRVVSAACDASNPRQKFTIVASGRAYAISNSSAYLQTFLSSGLILEELGDAELNSTWRLIDSGAAPTYGD